MISIGEDVIVCKKSQGFEFRTLKSLGKKDKIETNLECNFLKTARKIGDP